MSNGYDKQLEGTGDLAPRDLRLVRDGFIAQQPDMSALSPVEQAIAVEHKRLEKFASEQAAADKATGAHDVDWLGTWLDGEKEKAADKIRAKFEREGKEKQAQETARQAVDAFKMPIHNQFKFRL